MLAGAAHAQIARFERFSYQGQSQERVKTGSGEYRNPILSGYYPDPSIERVGDDFYTVNSSFSHFPGLPVFHSKDLVNWTQIANAIDRPDQVDFTGRDVSQGLFAPDISYHDGLFYIINTCVGCKGNFVITAKRPEGPWSDPAWLDFGGIDPAIYWEGDKAYVVNSDNPIGGRRYPEHKALAIQELDWRNMKMVGERTQLIDGGVDPSKNPQWLEGPHIFRRGRYYYLIAAEGGTGDAHSEVVFRATGIGGPYLPFDANPILTQRDLDPARSNPVTSIGHGKIIEIRKDDWWAVFLGTRPYGPDEYAIGRETFMLPVTWQNDWPIILQRNRRIAFAAPKPRLPAQPRAVLPTSGDFGYVDEFDGNRLGLQWIGVRTPKKPFYRLEGGALILGGGAALGDRQGVPAFIGRRQQHHIATVSTVLDYTPAKDGDRAGLAAIQSDQSWLFFGVTKISGAPVIALYMRDKATSDTLVASAPIATNKPVTLTMHANGGRMAFDYAVGAERRTLKADLDSSFLSTHRAGGFVGTVIGPYAYAP